MHEGNFSFYCDMIQWNGQRYTFDEHQVRTRLRGIREAGVEWIGVNGINLLEPTEQDFADGVRQTQPWLADLGLRMSSFHFAGPTLAPLDGGQSAVDRNFVRNVEIFAPWQPRSFVIHAGWFLGQNRTDGITAALEAECARHGYDAVLETLAQNLKRLARAAAPHGIRLALETMGNFLPFGNARDLPRLIEAIDEPTVGYCLDSGHAHLAGESVAAWVLRCGDRLFETHFQDNRGLGKDEHLPVGFGTIDWPGVIQALHRTGFPGPVTFETGGWPGLDPVAGYRQVVRWWQACTHLAGRSDP